jgi:hypothetical protein
MKGRKQRKRPLPKKRQLKRPYRRTKNAGPQTARQYFSKSTQFQQTWDSIAHVISKMRSDHVSLSKAAREFRIDPRQVIRLGRLALRKQKNGRYAARKTDRLLRVLSVLTPEGKREIALRDSRQASVIGSHWDAVQRYLQTGDDSVLREFHRKKITDASRKRHLLLTDLDELDRLGSAGVLSFESLYGRSV